MPKEVPAASTAPLNATLKEAATREAMQLTGTPSVASITRSRVGPAVRSD